MVEWLAVVAGESILAVLAVAPGCVVATLLANAAAPPARLLEHLHAEATLVGVAVALTGCTGEGGRMMGVTENDTDNWKGALYKNMIVNYNMM